MMNSRRIFREPWAANAPATKSRESPGRNGAITKPVSRNIIKNRKR